MSDTDNTNSTDGTEPGAQLDEEPQSERGETGSRDTGDPEPAGGPADRDAEESDSRDYTSINPQEPSDDAPNIQPGSGS